MRDDNYSAQPSRWRSSNERNVRLPKQPGNDRRGVLRYPLNLRLRYSVLNSQLGVAETGSGQTIDLSSSGMRFFAEKPITPGLKVELFLDWPYLLDGTVQLHLIASGIVVRSNGAETALRIHKHDFKTRGRGLTSSSQSS